MSGSDGDFALCAIAHSDVVWIGGLRVTGTLWGGRRAEATPAKSKTAAGKPVEDQEALDLQADWADISQGLRKDLGLQLFNQWIRPIQLGSFCKETGTLDLFLPTEFSANWVADRFADRLSLAWKIARSEVRHVRISVHPGRRQMPDLRLGRDSSGRDSGLRDSSARRAANDSMGEGRAIGLPIADINSSLGDTIGLGSIGLDPSLIFATFVTGTANVLACNAAQRMAAVEVPQFSPLYLKAATGQGKTHLLPAIGHAYLANHPRSSAAPEPDDRVQIAPTRL